jgi:hypothetical protein
MMEISRRKFFFGVAAAVALASLPAPVAKIVRRVLPGGLLPLDGRELSVEQYPELFAAILRKYGGVG